MNDRLNSRFLGLPIGVWIAQILYVVVSLALLAILFRSLSSGSVSVTSSRLFIIVYIIVMVVANIIWRLGINKKMIAIVIASVSIAILINIVIAQVFILHGARSSFNNYYKYRGCSELIGKSADSAVCNLPSGQTIKIVRHQNRWNSDTDLPNGFFSF